MIILRLPSKNLIETGSPPYNDDDDDDDE